MRSIVSLLAQLGAAEAAAVLYGALGSSAAATPVFGDDAERLAVTMQTLLGELGREQFDDATRRGGAMDDDQAVGFALEAIAEIMPGGSTAGVVPHQEAEANDGEKA